MFDHIWPLTLLAAWAKISKLLTDTMSTRSPVFLVPGLTGSQLRDCVTGNLLWLNVEMLLNCPESLMDYLDVRYDSRERRFINVRGVLAGAGGLGDLEPIRIISEPPAECTGQFDCLINYLSGIGGYQEGTDLFGVPYDWRLILDDTYWKAFAKAFTQIVEENTGGCSNTRATLIGYSLGGLVITRFLRGKSCEWRAKYISRCIFISTPLGGCPMSLTAISGGKLDNMPYDSICIRRFIRRCGGVYMCHPLPDAFPRLLIARNVPKKDCEDEFVDYAVDAISEVYNNPSLGMDCNAQRVYTDYRDIIEDSMRYGIADDIELHVVYSSSRDTTVAVDFQRQLDKLPCDVKESTYYSELAEAKRLRGEDCESILRKPFGDGVVPHLSLAYWNNKHYSRSGLPLVSTIKQFSGRKYEHSKILRNTEVVQYVYSLLGIACLDQHLVPQSDG